MTSIDPLIASYYTEYDEASRLHTTAVGRLEFERTRELLRRSLPPPPARVLDVGGGPGTHARWLVEDGYEVLLVDPVPKHVEQAREYAPGCSAELGDARESALPADSWDAVLLLGPLYHLSERGERLAALREARRVAVPGGLVAVAGISRHSLLQEYTVSAGLTPELLAGEAPWTWPGRTRAVWTRTCRASGAPPNGSPTSSTTSSRGAAPRERPTPCARSRCAWTDWSSRSARS
ncbi:class I SAM-dependent methyltransferase [Streptomyces sp. NBC_01426]|uniref:class I SAM-dependent methyltransferase n=1 Tax=Streptomyces sp. NBC_01426 TaxID=2975866 RepID=UPI002E381FE5|nr:class I SAM-dependent methyltransferase [Streptomyces sp. NBC_01426]